MLPDFACLCSGCCTVEQKVLGCDDPAKSHAKHNTPIELRGADDEANRVYKVQVGAHRDKAEFTSKRRDNSPAVL